MDSVLILTISGIDEVGLVERLADVVAAHGGNWEHCRMAHLAGRFAGILQVRVSAGEQQELEVALRTIKGLDVMIAAGRAETVAASLASPGNGFTLELTGGDHPGIVRDVFKALARSSVNVEELNTSTEPAPDSGVMLFRAQARLSYTGGTDLGQLREELQAIAADVMVDLNLS